MLDRRIACNLIYPIFLMTALAHAQRGTGELRLTITDPAGLPLTAHIELASLANQVRRDTGTDAGGATLKNLPFGPYRLTVTRTQFTPATELLEIRSEAPVERRIQLQLAAAEATIVIADSATLLDPHRTGTVFHLGAETIRDRRATQPSRGLLELVETQPGWLLEANGVLHPRGSEYNTQYVIDGIPIADNRSPAFAPPLDVDDIQSMNVFTSGYPAEYGRKLGGVVEATTNREVPGLHGKVALQNASFDTRNAFASAQYLKGRTGATFSAQAGQTDRYLDPPSESNYTNRGSFAGLTARVEHDISDSDRVRFYVHRRQTSFLVPNEDEQQEAGQRQDRRGAETMGQAAWQRVLSPRSILHVRGMLRDLSSELWSNPLSTPLIAFQDRGFREGYLNASVSYNRAGHELKWGGEFIGASVREKFRVIGALDFAGRAQSREGSGYMQDLIRAGRWTFSTGLRFDRYSFLVRDSAWSPRFGAAWHWAETGLVFRASYDRAFEVPAIENLLAASSFSSSLPIPPSRGNFYQAGFSKTLGAHVRLDANWFRRNVTDFADDDVFLNTGISFPIAFARANIHGYEAKLDVPQWGRFSGFVSYSNLVGAGYLPITGGLFLNEALESKQSFPITQDQRNTAQGRLRFQAHRRVWTAFGARYGSGLPVELEDEFDFDDASPRILARVDFERGRVKPWHALDAAIGADLWIRERQAVRLLADVTNFTDRLNVINFAGLFSGTALAAPRAWSLRLTGEF